MNKKQSNMTNKQKVQRQKQSNGSYRGRRLNHQQRTAMRKAAREVTDKYPLRFWAQWTTRTFGWWGLVVNGKWTEIAPRCRDLDEVRWALKRARDESKMQAEWRLAFDDTRKKLMALQESLDNQERVAKALGR